MNAESQRGSVARIPITCQHGNMPKLPEDSHLTALGRTIYLLNGLEWMVIEIVQRLDPATKIGMLAGMTSHQIADQLRSKTKKQTTLSGEQVTHLAKLVDDYASLPDIRNSVVHARPATMQDGKQRLYRWAPGKRGAIYWVDEPLLAALSERATQLEREFDEVRTWLPVLPR